jgi:hypothetical protein
VSIRSEDWLDGAACHTARPERAEAPPVRLSDLQPEQKRELAGFGLAAVASCAFLVTPLILAGVGPELPSTALAIQLVSAPRVANDSTIVAATAPRSHVTRRTRTGEASLRTARAALAARAFSQRDSAPQLVATVAARNNESIDTDAPEQADAPQPSSRVLRGVSRVLLGDGRHRVRPFPTPIAEQN